MTTTASETTPARAPGTVPALVLLSPQPDHAPFRIGGDTSGNWYNERRAYRRGGNYSVMLIHWTPPAPGMIPVRNVTTGHKWAWQNRPLCVKTHSEQADDV